MRAVLAVALMIPQALTHAHAENPDNGRVLLESSCGRCHSVVVGAPSPLAKAPNLKIVLGSYESERLRFELAEGIGSRHPTMPQVQFSAEEIDNIEAYLANR